VAEGSAFLERRSFLNIKFLEREILSFDLDSTGVYNTPHKKIGNFRTAPHEFPTNSRPPECVRLKVLKQSSTTYIGRLLLIDYNKRSPVAAVSSSRCATEVFSLDLPLQKEEGPSIEVSLPIVREQR